MELHAKIESLLYFKGEPITIKKIAEILNTSKEEVEAALATLIENKKNSGLVVVQNNEEVTLGTTPEASEFLEKLRKDEMTKELSKASLETLSIILYKNGVTRAEIDYIRGVNSSFILRNMLIRGLVERSPDPKDNRRIIYKPTLDTLQFMGVTDITALPRYDEVLSELQKTITIEGTQNE